MSIAMALAGASVVHIGAVGLDGQWTVGQMKIHGIDISSVATVDTPTGHAVVNCDPSGENEIVIFPGANRQQSKHTIRSALANASSKTTLLLQNETSEQSYCAKLGRSMGMKIVYAAAPFDGDAVRAVLPYIDVLILNSLEMSQLELALDCSCSELDVERVIVTDGSRGCTLYSRKQTPSVQNFPAPRVTAVDTTAAGDTFCGYVVAGLDQGLTIEEAIRRANAAAALKVTKKGTADAIPSLSDVLRFLD